MHYINQIPQIKSPILAWGILFFKMTNNLIGHLKKEICINLWHIGSSWVIHAFDDYTDFAKQI